MRHLICFLMIFMSGCTTLHCAKVPKPTYPEVKIVDPGSFKEVSGGILIPKVQYQNILDNMVNMSRMIDEEGICPCWEGK